MSLVSSVKELATVDLFSDAPKAELFVGRPFALSYGSATLLVADAWKQKVGGIPQGAFLLAFYKNEPKVAEALLLRALRPSALPTADDVVRSMIEYYKDDLRTSGKESQLDDFTRYEFGFSGLECRILGTFYLNANGKLVFGADVENYYSPHHYDVFKPTGPVLELIANFRDDTKVPGGANDVRIGSVRFSSSTRFQEQGPDVPVFVSAGDFLGKRTALFGMTRTGKSNTVKKIIQATVELSRKAVPAQSTTDRADDAKPFDAFASTGLPRLPVGQIIFDMNGEYANANLQDEGTAVFELYKDDVVRYSVLDKPDFRVMKVNFYLDVPSGFSLVQSALSAEAGDYMKSFLAADLETTVDPEERGALVRRQRLVAAYHACLYQAGFTPPKGFTVKFPGQKEINAEVRDGGLDPSKGIALAEAVTWFSWVWENYQSFDFFEGYRKSKGRDWADENLKAVLVFLTRQRTPGKPPNASGFVKLRPLTRYHTPTTGSPFADDIVEALRAGRVVIVDLSQGDPQIQALFSERICQRIFADAMGKFVETKPNNFIQFYFEEAHNLFPKKEDKDLSQVYNRLAKEGAKLNLGLIYATQEVSSISANILKNTQNWFIAHLNNEDEVREIRKFYDFADFSEALVRFSADSDKGFVRMKTYSNPYVVPVQIDRFLADVKE